MKEFHMASRITRRRFIHSSAAGAAGLCAGAALGAAPAVLARTGDDVRLGVIGTGGRGQHLIGALGGVSGARVTALCDIYDRHREEAARLAGAGARTFVDAGDLLARDDVDAVVIATTSHWHGPLAIAALEAGKDVYVEKPAFHSVAQGERMNALCREQGRLVQVGTQRRSSEGYRLAAEAVRGGELGRVTLARGWWHRNSTAPMWRHPIYPDINPRTLDWRRFLGGAPERPFDPVRFRDFHLYWDYSFGVPTELLWHQIDIILAVLGPLTLARAGAVGGVFRWRDGRETPDTFSGVCEFEEGVCLEVSSIFGSALHDHGEEFLGTEGTIRSSSGSWRFTPESVAPAKRPPREVRSDDSVARHLASFVDSVRTRRDTVCNAGEALRVGRVVLALCEAFLEGNPGG
jgi:predicted dehydrogenase